MIHSFRKTKIIATLGPASSTYSVIKELAETGVNVFRLNFSHGTHEAHKKNASIIRNIEQELGVPLAIMLDLQGPKFRIGVFEDGQVTLRNGAKFFLDMKNEFGTHKRVTLPHPEIFDSLSEGVDILLDDGKIKLQVIDNTGDVIETKVLVGGVLSNKKGFNIPGVLLPVNSLTEKDIRDIRVAEAIEADYIAVSFVQTADDIIYARKFVKNHTHLIAKIEKPKAVENLEQIVKEADAVMVARGDLGVEMPIEKIPSIQRQIISICRELNKPVIVATQMLESMTQNSIPTRAEVSDIAAAVYQGADAVMLSAESANGSFPKESVNIMRKVIENTEKDIHFQDIIQAYNLSCKPCSDLIPPIMQNDSVKFIAAFTESGRTAIDVASYRSKPYIVALTPNFKTVRKMCLVWGTYGLLIEDLYSFSQMIQVIQTRLLEFCGLQNGDQVAVVAGVPFRKSGTTNLCHICKIAETSKNINL